MDALVADLHVHSRFSRATGRDLLVPGIARAALSKGLGLVASGDFTHPGWLAELEAALVDDGSGLLRLAPALEREVRATLPPSCQGGLRFVLEVEISCIYRRHGRVRRNHNLVYLPGFDEVHAFNARLGRIGNLRADGRPILGLDARDLLEIVRETSPLGFLVPAHIWTPWFSLFGSRSGFDGLAECFGDLVGEIFAVETGLSSDPPMNWRVGELDGLSLVSSSDAHSAGRLGREATLLAAGLPDFAALRHALATGDGLLGTLEFFPEEGKYHLDGHRACGLRLAPEETRRHGGRCPRCGGALTVGVQSRVEELADRPAGHRPAGAKPFESLVPLDEVVAAALDQGPATRKVRELVERLTAELGPELALLRAAPLDDLSRVGGARLAEAVRRVRTGELDIAAGYDGEFGTVRIFRSDEQEPDRRGQKAARARKKAREGPEAV